MKRFLTALLCAITVFTATAFGACANESAKITVYAPDGAPALALAELMHNESGFGKEVEYHITDSSEITSHVTYEDDYKNADLCILPVNAASKLLGNGNRYKVLGAVTHGNLFIVSGKDKEDVTAENFKTVLGGAKIGVVNLPAFPGAVTKLLLNKFGVENATLQNVKPTEIDGNGSEYDYFVMPEPAASTRTGVAALNLKTAGNLQTLYGGQNGYPQAVLVAKTSLIESDFHFINDFQKALGHSSQWLLDESVTAETILAAVTSHYADPENTAPAFNSKNLTKTVIKNCAVRFTVAGDCWQSVMQFLKELKAAGDATATEVTEEFFHSLINEPIS